jgi:hypothetical protein
MASVRKIETMSAVLPRKKRVAAYARVSSGKDAMLHSLSRKSVIIVLHPSTPEWTIWASMRTKRSPYQDTRAEFQRLLAIVGP